MDEYGWGGVRSTSFALVMLVLPACTQRTPVDTLPTPQETLRAVGLRLSRSYSAAELTRLAMRGDRLAAALTRSERDALGRGYLRFRTNRPVIVDVAVSSQSIPFWLADQGFRATG